MPRRPLLALIAAAAALAALAFVAAPVGGQRDYPAEHVGTFVWSRGEAEFGGFSALDLAPGGREFVAATDRGILWRGTFRRDAAGIVTGVETDGPRAIPGPGGRALRRGERDSEGIARADDGTIYISFEGIDRVSVLPADGAAPFDLPRLEAFRRLPHNKGLESLAIDPEGRILTLPEESGARGRPFPVWRWTGTAWQQPFTLPRDGRFVPTGADFGPDGALYLLERDFLWVLGFRTRISRFGIGPDGPGPREILLETHGPVHDNLEGISVWADAAGMIRLTLISDDNFSFLQRTEIVDYRLP